jgi:hypothetical protein
MGVLFGHVAQLDETKRAMTAAMAGDRSRATKVYNSARAKYLIKPKSESPTASPRSGSKRRRDVDEPSSVSSAVDGTQPTREERQLWSSEMLTHLAAIGHWSTVGSLCSAQKADSLLRPAGRPSAEAHAWTRVAVRDRARWPDLWQTVAALTSNRRSELESTWMPVELSLIAVAQNDFERAEFVVRAFRRAFLGVWPRFHPLARAARRVYLQRLQPVHEIEEYLALARAIGAVQARSVDEATAAAAAAAGGAGDELRDAVEQAAWSGNKPVDATRAIELHRQLLRRWRARLPSLADGALAWDDVATVRDVLLQKLADQAAVRARRVEADADDDDDAALDMAEHGHDAMRIDGDVQRARERRLWSVVEKAVRRERSSQLLVMARGALHQRNPFGADSYLKRHLKIGDERDANRVDSVRLLVRCIIAKAGVEMHNDADKGVYCIDNECACCCIDSHWTKCYIALKNYAKALHYTEDHFQRAKKNEATFLRIRADICQQMYAVSSDGEHASMLAAHLIKLPLARAALGAARRSFGGADVMPLVVDAGIDALARAVVLSEPDRRFDFAFDGVWVFLNLLYGCNID